MAEPEKKSSQDIFTRKVVPIMDKVKNELQSKQAEEYRKHSNSMGALFAAAAGPDGGMSATAAYNDTIYYTGEWNSKTVEDYIERVKAELKRQNIKVDAVIEKKMVDRLVRQQMPKSVTEYILRKAAQGTIFYMPQRVRTSFLQAHINEEGDKLHNPSLLEDITGNVLSWGANAATTAGFGGTWGQIGLDLAVEGSDRIAPGQSEKYRQQEKDKAKKEVEAARKKPVDVPKWMMTQMGFTSLDMATDKQLVIALKWAEDNSRHQQNAVNKALENGERVIRYGKNTKSISDATIGARQFDSFAQSIKQEQKSRLERINNPSIAEANEQYSAAVETNTENQSNMTSISNSEYQSGSLDTQSQQNNGDYNGWNNLLGSMGLEGIGDTVNHLGVTLAMLPDMLVGILTGKTKSIGLNKSTMFPLTAILSGAFIKNPMLKIPLMLWGGANLVNKMGQEALSDFRQNSNESMSRQQGVQFKKYDDEQLNARIKDPRIEGNVIVMDIDNVPRVITLPDNAVAAYQAGALPLNTLANAILAKSDQMNNTQQVAQQESQDVSRHYEQKQEREQVRGIR